MESQLFFTKVLLSISCACSEVDDERIACAAEVDIIVCLLYELLICMLHSDDFNDPSDRFFPKDPAAYGGIDMSGDWYPVMDNFVVRPGSIQEPRRFLVNPLKSGPVWTPPDGMKPRLRAERDILGKVIRLGVLVGRPESPLKREGGVFLFVPQFTPFWHIVLCM